LSGRQNIVPSRPAACQSWVTQSNIYFNCVSYFCLASRKKITPSHTCYHNINKHNKVANISYYRLATLYLATTPSGISIVHLPPAAAAVTILPRAPLVQFLAAARRMVINDFCTQTGLPGGH
jgi:hypothetical protein